MYPHCLQSRCVLCRQSCIYCTCTVPTVNCTHGHHSSTILNLYAKSHLQLNVAAEISLDHTSGFFYNSLFIRLVQQIWPNGVSVGLKIYYKFSLLNFLKRLTQFAIGCGCSSSSTVLMCCCCKAQSAIFMCNEEKNESESLHTM